MGESGENPSVCCGLRGSGTGSCTVCTEKVDAEISLFQKSVQKHVLQDDTNQTSTLHQPENFIKESMDYQYKPEGVVLNAFRWDAELLCFFFGLSLSVLAFLLNVTELKWQLLLLYFIVWCEYFWTMWQVFRNQRSADKTPGANPHFWFIAWLAPWFVGLTLVFCCQQTMQHLRRIEGGTSPLKHRQAVQVLALPAVYGVMALSSLVRIGHVVQGKMSKNDLDKAMLKSETCFQVGNLFEAWALYQISVLTLAYLKSAVMKMLKSAEVREQAKAEGLLIAHNAVQSLTRRGTLFFFVVCTAQCAWSVWICFSPETQVYTGDTNGVVLFLNGAGSIAALFAMYNVVVVDATFHEQLRPYNAVAKFLSVKIIVSLDFVQWSGFWIFNQVQHTLTKKPIFTEVQLRLIYSSLICVELLGLAILHAFAWDANESWYKESGDD